MCNVHFFNGIMMIMYVHVHWVKDDDLCMFMYIKEGLLC